MKCKIMWDDIVHDNSSNLPVSIKRLKSPGQIKKNCDELFEIIGASVRHTAKIENKEHYPSFQALYTLAIVFNLLAAFR